MVSVLIALSARYSSCWTITSGFAKEHKWLLSAQVQLQGGLDALRTDLHALAGNVNTLTSNIEAMRAHFNARLSRLGGC